MRNRSRGRYIWEYVKMNPKELGAPTGPPIFCRYNLQQFPCSALAHYQDIIYCAMKYLEASRPMYTKR